MNVLEDVNIDILIAQFLLKHERVISLHQFIMLLPCPH
jgi:hypothetical protein